MNTPLTTKFSALAMAALVTISVLGGLDALATTGQSSEALLAQPSQLQMACTDGARKS